MSRLLPLRIYYFASFAALGAYAPYFPTWLEARGLEGVSMGVVSALLPAMGVVGPPLAGLLADALGVRGALLQISCLGAAIAIAVLAAGAARASGAPSFAVVFACVAAYAAFRSPLVMLADVVAMEHAPADGTTYGAVRAWGSAGFLLAAFLVGRWVDVRSNAALPLTIGALLFVAFLAALPLPAKPASVRLPVGREARALLGSPSFVIFLVVSLLGQAAHASYDLCFSLRLGDLGASETTVGAAWALGVAFEVALLARADRLLTRVRAPTLVTLALLGAAARWALLAWVTSIPVLIALAPLHAISFALWWVASIAYVKERAKPAALATAQGLFSGAYATGGVAGMVTWGSLYRQAGGGAVFASASVIALVATVLALVWRREWSRKTQISGPRLRPRRGAGRP